MRLNCPWCGERPDAEFRSAGEAVERPLEPADLDEGQWAQYVYGRDNLPGPVRELWWHWAGCRQWLLLERDTVSHRILRVESAIDQPREPPRPAAQMPQASGDEGLDP